MFVELHPWALNGVEEVPAQQKVEHEEGEEGERPPDVVHVVSSSRGKRLNTLMVKQQLYILQNEVLITSREIPFVRKKRYILHPVLCTIRPEYISGDTLYAIYFVLFANYVFYPWDYP